MMFLKNKNKTRWQTKAGFTLIEMLLVLTIIALISFNLFTNYRTGAANSLMRTAADDVASSMRRAQGASLSGQLYGGAFMRDYRVFFDTTNPSTYYICATTFTDSSTGYCSATSLKIVETIILPQGVTISDVQAGTAGSVGKAEIVFPIPYGDPTTFYGAVPTMDARVGIKVVLRSANNSTITISVDGESGRIEIL